MPTCLNPLFHPYVRPAELARMIIYLRKFRFAARKIVKQEARANVLRRMRERSLRFPYPV